MPVSSILLVDDDESTFHFTQALVRDFSGGHTTLDWEPSYDGGLATLLENRHDVALIDFRLGTDDGVQLLRDARKGGCATPLIMLTGRAVRGTDAEALSAGADDYLVKGEVTATQLERSLRYAAERRHVRDLLKKREADYRATFENAPIGMAHTGLDGRWLRVNERLKSLLGYSEDQLLSTDAQSLTHPDDIEASATGRAQLLDGTLSLFATEKRYRRADGDYLWVHLTVSVRRSAGGQPRHFIATMEDISARKKAQRELTHVFDLSPDMICTVSFDGYFTRTNPAFTKVLGFSAEQLQQSLFLSFVHEDDRAATVNELGRLAEGQTTFGFTNRYRTASGEYRLLEWHSRADTDAKLIYAIARDQTDKRLLEEQVRHAQKMEAVGRLAGGVAHDFNNLLTAIVGFAEMAIEQLPASDPVRGDIAHIVHAGHRATALTRQLLAFSRKQILAPRILDLNALVTGMQPMLQRLIGEHVELQTVLDDALLRISADAGQIEQVIMNLAVNARDAMPKGGVLCIGTDMVTLAAVRYVRLTVNDTGVGMAPDVLTHLFEPFFTTKEQGKGTGLGLATVHGIVQQSGGSISVHSTTGVGSDFAVHFPAVDGAVVPVSHPGTGAADPTGSETILLVEDQAEVREVVSQLLMRRGYVVLEACDGASALELLRTRTEAVDLILTDIVMPGMNGREMVDRLEERHRGICVLYMSGYTDDEILKHGALHPDMNFLHKPFRAEQLLSRVRDILDRATGDRLLPRCT